MTASPPPTPTSVAAMLDAVVARDPDAPAVHYGEETTTYATVADKTARLAGFLAGQGIGPGDRVAFWLPSVPAYLYLYLACARLGAVAVAVNTRFRAAEVGDILTRSRAGALVLWPTFKQIDFAGILAAVDPDALAAIRTAVVYDEGACGNNLPDLGLPDARVTRYADAERHAPFDGDHGGPDVACNIFTTSGTTSKPKLVVHRQFAIAVHATEAARDFGLLAPDTVTLQALPLCGVFGFCQMMAALAAGRPMVMTAAFDAEEAMRLCERHRVTQFNATDDMMDRMLRTTDSDAPFAAITFVGYAAFNRALDDLPERAAARGVRMVGLWGMSELQALAARRDENAPVAERKKPGGRLVSSEARARVRDPATGALLPVGEAGALEITGPSRMVEYLDDPAATAAAITDDGYVRTGDLGVMEPDGSFEFLARMGDTLRLSGFLVSPAEIEAEVMAAPGVTAAQVVEASVGGQHRAVAFVTLAPGAVLDEAAALAHCADRLANFKRPARIVAIDAFPVTESANGTKIQRAKLREMAEALGDSG